MSKILLYFCCGIFFVLVADYLLRIISNYFFLPYPEMHMTIIDGRLFLTHVKHYAAIMPNAIEFEVSGKMYYIDHFITRLSVELALVFLIIKRDFIRDPIACYIFVDFVGAIGNVGELLFHGYVTDYIGFSYSGGDGVVINFSDMLIGSGGYVFFVVVIVHLISFFRKNLEKSKQKIFL